MAQIIDNFNSYAVGDLAGNGAWSDDIIYGHIKMQVLADKSIGSGGESGNWVAVKLPITDLIVDEGFDLSFKIVALCSNDQGNVFFGDWTGTVGFSNNVFGESYFYVYNFDHSEYINIFRLTNYSVGDIVRIRLTNKRHLEMYLNGEIDTMWESDSGDPNISGADGIFDIAFDFTWYLESSITIVLFDSTFAIDDFDFTYNIPIIVYAGVLKVYENSAWTPRPLDVQKVQFDPRPVRAYIDGQWQLIQSF